MTASATCHPCLASLRRAVLVLAVLAALIGLLGWAPSARAAGLPPQGLYEECAPYDQQQCAGELAQMAHGGFRLALNYTAWYGSAAEIRAYAAEAQADGIKLIWPLNAVAWRGAASLVSTYPDLAVDCGCTTNAQFLRYAISLVASLPATWGYYVGDELNPLQAVSVAGLSAQLRALDAGHPLLYIGQTHPDLIANLLPFLSSSDVIGADPYPVGTGTPLSSVATAASSVEHLTQTGHKRSAMVLQAFSWSEYPNEMSAVNPHFPTVSEMATMRNAALASNPSMILWYNLHDLLQSDDPAGHWRDLVAAAFGPVPGVSGSSKVVNHRAYRAHRAQRRHQSHRARRRRSRSARASRRHRR
ncbi:MAG: hypothetical protein ACYC91_02715 [Solirubrobacteraceae bacterium]